MSANVLVLVGADTYRYVDAVVVRYGVQSEVETGQELVQW